MQSTTGYKQNPSMFVMAMDLLARIIWFVTSLAVRTLVSASLILAYNFYHATSETTIFELSGLTHFSVFWFGAVCLALLYTGWIWVFQGPSRSMSAHGNGAGGVSAVAVCKQVPAGIGQLDHSAN